MPRNIDVEIAIGGVGLLWVTEPEGSPPQDGKWRPSTAENLLVLFPAERTADDSTGARHGAGHGAHGTHNPTLSFYAGDNLLLPVGSQLVSSPDGREVVNVDLTQRRVFFEPPFPYSRDNRTSSLKWAVAGERSPDHDCLDWLLDADDIGLEDPDPARAQAVVHLPEGKVSARYLFRNRQSPGGEPILWEVAGRRQAIAPQFVVRMEGLWQCLRILTAPLTPDAEADRRNVDEEIELLADSGNLLRLSIANLPREFDGADSHLELLETLLPRGKKVSVPTKVDNVFTIGSSCDVPKKVGDFPQASLESVQGTLRVASDVDVATDKPFELPRYFQRIGATTVWDRGIEGSDRVGVAVIDSGIDTREGSRSYLNRPVVDGLDLTGSGDWYDHHGHGTMMASIVAAEYQPRRLIRGIASGVRVLNLKVLGGDGLIRDEGVLIDALRAVRDPSPWLRRELSPDRIHVALMPLALPSGSEGEGPSDALLEEIASLRDAGVLLVLAAGDQLDPSPVPELARLDHVLMVGRIDDGEEAYLSNGDRDSVNLAAPGTGVLAASVFGGARITGSSPAAAFVAGAAALAFSERPDQDPSAVKERILATARMVSGLKGKIESLGVLDIANLLGLGPTHPAATPARSSRHTRSRPPRLAS